MERDFLAQLALRADAVAIADDQHAHHQCGIDRGTSCVAVERCNLTMDAGQRLGDKDVDPAQQMTDRNSFFQVKG